MPGGMKHPLLRSTATIPDGSMRGLAWSGTDDQVRAHPAGLGGRSSARTLDAHLKGRMLMRTVCRSCRPSTAANAALAALVCCRCLLPS